MEEQFNIPQENMKDRYAKLVAWQWANVSTPTEVVRIFLGIALFIRGIFLWNDPASLSIFIDESGFPGLLQYITFAHIIGGLMLTVGFLTRLAALIQIPILTGAVFVVHLREGLASPEQSLELAALVLFLLLIIFAFGPGKWSIDYRMFGNMFAKPASDS